MTVAHFTNALRPTTFRTNDRIGAEVFEKPQGTILGWVADDHEVVITPDSSDDESTSYDKRVLVNFSTSCDTKSNSEFRSAKKIEITLSREAKLQIRDGRGILLRNVVCWIAEKDFPTGLGQVLLGKEALHRLGYSPRQMLHNTRLRMTDVDFDRVENEGDLQKETVGVCIQHEEVDFTEEKKVLCLWCAKRNV
ncbi:hypothetical protein ABG067_004265 [Albugo candida]